MIERNDTVFKYWLDRYKYHVRYPENSFEEYQIQLEKFYLEYNFRRSVFSRTPSLSKVEILVSEKNKDECIISTDLGIENLDISPLRISVDEEKLDKKNLVLLKELLEKFPGLSSVELEVNSKSGSKLLELKEIKGKKTNQLKNEISTLLAK